MRTALLASVLAAAATGAAELTPVSVQLNWLPEPEFGGIYAAQHRGLFAAEGLAVEILKGGPDVPAIQMAAAGRVTFAVAAADEVVALRDKGAQVTALFATYQTSPQGIMVRRDHPADGIGALLAHGGTLIAQPGLAYLKWLRQRFGMGSTRVVPYGAGAMAQFLDPRHGDVAMQCFVFAEPIAARRQGGEVKVFLVAETGFDPYTAVLVTRNGFLAANRQLCARFTAALRAGWRAYIDDPEPTNLIMARLNTAMAAETFSAAAAAQRPLLESPDTARDGLGTMTLARWRTLVDQLREIAVIEGDVPPQSCFVNLK